MAKGRRWIRGWWGVLALIGTIVHAYTQPAAAPPSLSVGTKAGLVGIWESDDKKEQIEITEDGAKGAHFQDWTLSKEKSAEFNQDKMTLYFDRTPTADEISAAGSRVPLPVAKQVAGKVIWRLALTLDAYTTPCRVTLSGKLRATPVRYRYMGSSAAVALGTAAVGDYYESTVGKGGPDADKTPDDIEGGPMHKLPRDDWGHVGIVNDGTAGTSADITALRGMLEDCAMKSQKFHELVDTAMKIKGKVVTLKVGRGQPDILVDSFEGHGTGRLDLGQIEKFFPCVALRQDGPGKGTWSLDPKDSEAKSWACSRCEILTHILAEEYLGALRNIAKLNKNTRSTHDDAINQWQIPVRKELGHPKTLSITQVLNKQHTAVMFTYGALHEIISSSREFPDGTPPGWQDSDDLN